MNTSYDRMEEGRKCCCCTFKPVDRGNETDQWVKTLERYVVGAFFYESGALLHTFSYIESKAAGDHITYLAYATKSFAIPFFLYAMVCAQYIARERTREFTKEAAIGIGIILFVEVLVGATREATEGARGAMIVAEAANTLFVTLIFYKTVRKYKPNNVMLFM